MLGFFVSQFLLLHTINAGGTRISINTKIKFKSTPLAKRWPYRLENRIFSDFTDSGSCKPESDQAQPWVLHHTSISTCFNLIDYTRVQIFGCDAFLLSYKPERQSLQNVYNTSSHIFIRWGVIRRSVDCSAWLMLCVQLVQRRREDSASSSVYQLRFVLLLFDSYLKKDSTPLFSATTNERL